MTALAAYRGRDVGVLGLGRSGMAVVRALCAAGARVYVFDDQEERVAAAVREGAIPGVADHIARLSLLVPSPGVPLEHRLVVEARLSGVRVVGDVQLYVESFPEARFVGVTGTNGKSTTASLLYHLLRESGRDAALLGNIGTPVFDGEPPALGVTVLELSSFQLERSEALSLELAVWVGFAPDHLDRHGDLAAYLAAKRRIFDGLRPGGAAVVALSDPVSRDLAEELRTREHIRVVAVADRRAAGQAVWLEGGWLVDGLGGDPVRVLDLGRHPRLLGPPQWRNAACAYAAARLLGLTRAQLAGALAGFSGLPHRVEPVARIGRVLFVNDSKATNPEAAAASLGAFSHVFWIAGGRPKPGGFAPIRPLLGRVLRAYAIGEAEDLLARALGDRVDLVRASTLERAVRWAFSDARAAPVDRPVVLLAPACASFDHYRDFAERGEHFRRLVRELEIQEEAS